MILANNIWTIMNTKDIFLLEPEPVDINTKDNQLLSLKYTPNMKFKFFIEK